MKREAIAWLLVVCLIISNIYFIFGNSDLKTASNANELESGETQKGEQQKPSGEHKVEIQKDYSDAIIKQEPIIDEVIQEREVDEEYDVIVFAAEPEGIITAISAARNGQDVLLVERRDGPGGLMTYAMLNTIDMNYSADRTLLSQGIFEEFFEKIGNKVSFDVEVAKKAFKEMIEEEENITVLYNVEEIEIGSKQEEIEKDGVTNTYSTIEYAIIDDKKYVADIYIDCTQDADITVAAGGEYVVGWEDVNEKNRAMSATLVIKMDGVDWNACCRAIDKAGIPNQGYSSDSIWAFGHITQKYVPTQPHMRLKALNIGLQNDGSVLINSLQVINVDMLDEKAKEKAYNKCVDEADNLAIFLKENVPGFEKASLVGVAPELYVRETRHIIGEHKLTVKDMLESTYSYYSIGMASYPIDVQTTSIYDWGYIIGAPDQYYIPMGTIIPKGFTNLMTIGRSGSYTSIAAGSARVIPTGMTLGQSAGIMAAICIEKEIDLQELSNNYTYRRDAQNRMKMQGIYIDDESKPVVDKDGQYYDFIIEMCELGILSLGYENKFDPNALMSEREFIVLTKTYLKRNFLSEDFWNTDHINLLDAKEEPITANRAKEIMYDITTFNIEDEETREKIERYIDLVAPEGSENLTTVRVYEILRYLKEFLVKNI